MDVFGRLGPGRCASAPYAIRRSMDVCGRLGPGRCASAPYAIRRSKAAAVGAARAAARLRSLSPYCGLLAHFDAVGFDRARVPLAAVFDDSFLRRVIDVNQAEALAVSICPLEIIH